MFDPDAGMLPVAVAWDYKVAPELLVLLAYRVTLGGAFSRDDMLRDLVSEGGGMAVGSRAIQLGRRLGYLKRWKTGNRRTTKWREELVLPGGEREPVVPEMFDGSLTLKELAVALFVYHGRGAQTEEIADRFGWSLALTCKVIDGLVVKGWLRPAGGAAAVFLELAARGIRVSLAGKDRVTVDGPANMSDDDIALIRSHKAVILAALKRSEAEQTQARTAALARFREAVRGQHVH